MKLSISDEKATYRRQRLALKRKKWMGEEAIIGLSGWDAMMMALSFQGRKKRRGKALIHPLGIVYT